MCTPLHCWSFDSSSKNELKWRFLIPSPNFNAQVDSHSFSDVAVISDLPTRSAMCLMHLKIELGVKNRAIVAPKKVDAPHWFFSNSQPQSISMTLNVLSAVLRQISFKLIWLLKLGFLAEVTPKIFRRGLNTAKESLILQTPDKHLQSRF